LIKLRVPVGIPAINAAPVSKVVSEGVPWWELTDDAQLLILISLVALIYSAFRNFSQRHEAAVRIQNEKLKEVSDSLTQINHHVADINFLAAGCNKGRETSN
jgi:hypothetical protein